MLPALVLAGCVTNFSYAWNAGGPIAISIGWPILCGFVLLVAFSMAELTSAFPTAGGPYWWAAKLGGAGWSWFTGWFNIVGLVGIVAGVGYGAALFLQAVLAIYNVDVLGINFATTNPKTILHEIFLLFLIIKITGWEWGWAALLVTVVLLVLSGVTAVLLRTRITKPLFTLTLAELRKDREWLRQTPESSR